MLYKTVAYADFKIIFGAVGTLAKVLANRQAAVGVGEVTQVVGITSTNDQVVCTMNPGTGPAYATVLADYPAVVPWTGTNITF